MSTATSAIAGRYKLLSRLGSGGMSTVELAFDQKLERYVAIKLLPEHLAAEPAHVARFRHEALAAARLIHPNIVQVFDCGFEEASGRHFIVMEYVSGQSCAELVKAHGRPRVSETVRILAQACLGLQHAHLLGVIHRDLKPANLLVSDTAQVKLADFGIARDRNRENLTEAGLILGTAAYLSPEQARGEEVGPRSDIYGLGVLAYELLGGQLPFAAATPSELLLRQRRAPVALSALNPLVPAPLAAAVMAALSLEPGDRPASASQFAAALRAGGEREAPEREDSTRVLATGGTRFSAQARPSQPTAATRAASKRRAPARRVRRAVRRTLLLGGLTVGLTAAMVALVYLRAPFALHALHAVSHYGHLTLTSVAHWASRLLR